MPRPCFTDASRKQGQLWYQLGFLSAFLNLYTDKSLLRQHTNINYGQVYVQIHLNIVLKHVIFNIIYSKIAVCVNAVVVSFPEQEKMSLKGGQGQDDHQTESRLYFS